MSRLIALCGIDGTGKSTQAALLQSRLDEQGCSTRLLWCRWDPRLARPAVRALDRLSRRRQGPVGGSGAASDQGDRRRALKRRVLSSAWTRELWTAVMVLDYGMQVAPKLWRARRSAEIVVVDRYRHDVMIDLSAGGSLRGTPRILRRLLPDPDLILVLDVAEEVALERKPDSLDVTYLRDRRRLYRELALAASATLIDAGAPADAVGDAVLDAVRSQLGLTVEHR